MKKSTIYILLTLLVVVVVSAAVVNYLSNTVVTDVTVKSPIELKVGESVETLSNGPLHLSEIFGGDTIEIYVSTENKVNTSVTGTMWNILSNSEGINCDDFTSLSAEVLYPDGSPWYPFSDIGCAPVDANSVRLISTPSEPWTWAPLHSDIAHILVTFDPSVQGTYILSTYVKP